MPLPTISFLVGLLVLAYLSTFLVFALLRIATGVSIQRVGYSGFRHISFTPRHGIDVAIRGVGISIHRPTFALPTWCSLVITELVVTVDLQALGKSKSTNHGLFEKTNGHSSPKQEKPEPPASKDAKDADITLWEKLTRVKESLKRLHSKIAWIRLVDLAVVDTRLHVVGVGCLQVERVNLSVDTRVKTVDRSRLFQHHHARPDSQVPAEWKSMVRSILFIPDTGESIEVLDYATLSIYGMLHSELQGLRDASLALKLGRLNIPYDDIEQAKKSADLLRGRYAQPEADYASAFVDVVESCDDGSAPHAYDERTAKNLSDASAFVASVLRGVLEVQFAIGFLGCSKRMDIVDSSGEDVYLNLEMKEFGLDVLRLDSKSPAHRMYFSPKDVAHQGLLTAIAISASIVDGHEHPERMFYIPMVTATVRTTLPSRTINRRQHSDAQDRNTNMLYANFVCTSPSVDLDPKHLPLVREMLVKWTAPRSAPKQPKLSRRSVLFQLLPKASIKLSVQEPVIRVALPPMNKSGIEKDDFDLLISTGSTMSLEVESSHAGDDSVHYNLVTKYQHSRHHVYYQTCIGQRHDLLHSESVELQIDVNAVPEPSVVASGRLQTFTWFLVRPEICEGVRQIMKQLRKNVLARHEDAQVARPSFLRTIPSWLTQCRIEGSDFGLELAGMDDQGSKDTRGLAVQLDSWTMEYKAQREQQPDMFTRRNSISRGTQLKEHTAHVRERSPRRRFQSRADGRRLTVHLSNLDGFVIDSVPDSEPTSFVSMPKFEVAFSTRTDNNGPIFHINTHARSVKLQYSLYSYFAIGVACNVIKKTFLDYEHGRGEKKQRAPSRPGSLRVPGGNLTDMDEIARHEVMVLDFKSNMLQLKATMPADPPMMVQIFGAEAGQHRWGTPFGKCHMARVYVRAPRTTAAWARLVTIKQPRVDIRVLKRKVGSVQSTEKSVDIVVESIRFAVPHSLVVHDIFDSVTNIIKTTKQLNHHFMTGTKDYIILKEPEGPKRVPRITFRAQLLIFDIEDSSFEWKLNAIYRAGIMEQKQRVAREEAFKIKEKLLARNVQRNGSKLRAHSSHVGNRSRSRARRHDANGSEKRSRSSQPATRPGDADEQRTPQARSRRRKMRYDADGTCGISDTSQLTIEAARDRLNQLNAQSWKNRIDHTLDYQSSAIREIRNLFFGLDNLPDDAEQHEQILALNHRPALLIATFMEFSITIDKPSFPIDKYADFLHEVGKGMPHDMKYGLLIPMSIHFTTSDLRFQLRDYPLPLLHVPALGSRQSARLPSFSLQTDFVIAEEFRDIESQRQVDVRVIPPEKSSDRKGLNIQVQRTISPVKTYSNMKIEINTNNPTKITWGTSYQPAIQDAMQVIEGFTKPPVDPSDRVGFWDKIRLSFHTRVNVAWKGDGDVHLILKGSRDPYVVTGQGAGLVMVWRNDVRWSIAQSRDPREFMTVDSTDYILAVPDFNSYARRSADTDEDDDASLSTTSSSKKDATFKKVVMKLSGNVRWLAGLMFERDIADNKRNFSFKPHYDVVLKHPDFAKAPNGEAFDAYHEFRSNHIHMSVAIAAPHDRQWDVTNLKPSNNYNAIHLTPRFFSHFFSWWSMFSGTMSLPIRQGPLWGATQKKSKKFGRHVATFKYNLLLSPLYISHVYKHKDAEDYKDNVVSATGLKMRLDSFMLDMHQRREYFFIQGHEGAEPKQSSGLRIHKAQLDFIHANLRALSASITGTSIEDIEKAGEDQLASLYGQVPSVDMSKFDIPDNDFDWIDMDDFVELDWILPAESDPQTKILPLGYCPRFTYFRQTDHNGVIAGDPTRTSPFGEEPTHKCVMSARNDPRRVQAELIKKRLTAISEHKARNLRLIGEHELKIIQSIDSEKATKEKYQHSVDKLQAHNNQLQAKYEFMESMLKILHDRLEKDDPAAVPDLETTEEFYEADEEARQHTEENANLNTAPLADYTSDFNNRFIVHNAQIKWNNSLRNIILRYIHQNGQRRGFVYYMSQRAVKFILDILEERKKAEAAGAATRRKSRVEEEPMASPATLDDDDTVQERIDQLLNDGRAFVNAEEATAADMDFSTGHGSSKDEIAVEYTALNTYHFRLIAPQIQLQSEKNPKAAVLFTAKGMQLKVIEIMDKDRVSDEVSGLVQRRFNLAADSLQMFVTTLKSFKSESLHMFPGEAWGATNSTFWPPWVPLEIMFDFRVKPYGFSRVVDETSVSIRYDKYNNLRLKYNDDVTGGDNKPSGSEEGEESESRKNHIWIEFPRFRAICDSAQYFALYIIVMDLLLYNEPLEKTRSERLEKIMLASDFSDLSGTPEMVRMLQERIRQLEEIKVHFQVNERFLDRQGWKDRISMNQDLASCEDELFFMMKAITTSQQRVEDRRDHDDVAGLLHLNISAKEIVWHLTLDKGESLMELQLKHAAFDRVVNNDGSNHNTVEIGRINGFNLLPNAIYPEIIAPFVDESRGIFLQKHGRMLRVHWLMLEAIAGIPVVETFEIDLVPLKLQIEREIAKKFFEYIFPSHNPNEGTGFSPFMVKHMLPTQEEDEEDDDKSSISSSMIMAQESSNRPTTPSHPAATPSLEDRLKPTLYLQKKANVKNDSKGLGISGTFANAHALAIFQNQDRSRSTLQLQQIKGNASRQVLGSTKNASALSVAASERSTVIARSDATSNDQDKKKPFTLRRSQSYERSKEKDKAPSDDLTLMMNRASNYMTLAFVRIPTVILCLSYRGQGKRNIEDVHDLVFRMPTLEYRNKTWSNLDLALQLKKDVIRALISHVGAIVGNKFSHHKPSKQQQARLREIANMNTSMSPAVSQVGLQPTERSSLDESASLDVPGRPSTASTRPSTLGISYYAPSTPSLSSVDVASQMESNGAPEGHSNGHTNGLSTPQRDPSVQGTSPQSQDGELARTRTLSLSRHLPSFGERRRQKQAESNANSGGEETEETRRKSKLLLGGQKLLRTLRD